MSLKKHFASLNYDKNYQDIEYLGFKGYSQSFRSWQNLINNYDWKDKVICDLGCFHCYFSMKVIQSGARKVYALDRSPPVLETARMIIKETGIKGIETREWTGGDEIPECDLILCLNVLHHFSDIPAALSQMKVKTLFEINQSDLEKVLDRFNILVSGPSHRDKRGIYLCERK